MASCTLYPTVPCGGKSHGFIRGLRGRAVRRFGAQPRGGPGAVLSWTHLESCLLCGWRVAWRSPARPAQPASLLHLLCWFAGAVTIVCWRWPVLASSGAGPSPVGVASVDE